MPLIQCGLFVIGVSLLPQLGPLEFVPFPLFPCHSGLCAEMKVHIALQQQASCSLASKSG